MCGKYHLLSLVRKRRKPGSYVSEEILLDELSWGPHSFAGLKIKEEIWEPLICKSYSDGPEPPIRTSGSLVPDTFNFEVSAETAKRGNVPF